MINPNDLKELQRLATNLYDDEKKFVYRIIHEATAMDKEIRRLKAGIEALRKAAENAEQK